jgi:hypothetical protein
MVQPYSINSSARATNASATVSPSLFATLRLMTNSKRVGCSMADPLALAFQYLVDVADRAAEKIGEIWSIRQQQPVRDRFSGR